MSTNNFKVSRMLPAAQRNPPPRITLRFVYHCFSLASFMLNTLSSNVGLRLVRSAPVPFGRFVDDLQRGRKEG
jgi:hypothetical protein